MALSLLESIRKLIRQDTVKVGGTIGNLHGAVRTDLGELSSSTIQTWLAMTIPGRQMPTLAEFLSAFAENPSSMRLEAALDGVTSVTSGPSTITLLRTVVDVERTTSFSLDLEIPNTTAVAAVYVDGVLQRTLRSSGAVPVSIPAGKHVLYVLLASPTAKVTVPTRIALVGETDVPKAPEWVSITSGYLDEVSGGSANVLRWASDPEVGNYRVLRRQPVLIGDLTVAGDGEVIEVSGFGGGDTYTILLGNDQTERIEAGAVLLSSGETVGIVLRTGLDTNGDTEVVCRLPLGLSEPPSLVGQLLYTGTFTELTRVTRVANTAYVEYVDSAVSLGTSYEYALQATGLVDESVLSPLSQVQFITTGDGAPPGSITLVSGYPKVLNRNVTVRFTTPADLDYAGVNTYWRQEVKNGANPYAGTAVSGPTVTVSPGTLTASTLAGYRLRLNVPNYTGATYTITGNSTSTLTLSESVDADFAAAFAAAAPVNLTIYKDTQVKTDAGLPNRLDEFSFFAANYGTYYFVTVDRSGNQQDFSAGVTWNYTTAQDYFTGPPVLAVRQLTTTEQAFFTGYTDAVRYAVLELWAYDPSRETADRFTGVKIFYHRVGQDANPVELTPIPSQAEAFPNTVTGAGEAVLDTVPSPRSRFVLVDRNFPRVRLWAQNSAGLTSDLITFVADLDTTPEVTVDTYINPLNDTASFVVVADDDTQSFTWSIDGGAATTVDSRTTKNFTISVPGGLELGQLKKLTVIPYGVFPPAAPAGVAVLRDLVRTPRSYVTFEAKDAAGNRSATETTANFSMVPAPAILASGSGAVTTDPAGGFFFTPSPAPSWTVNQFQNYCYLILKSGTTPVAIRPIASNTTTALRILRGVTVGSYNYEIVDGAVMWRRLTVGTTSDFEPTLGRESFTKTVQSEVEFYATRRGSYPENVRRVVVDQDNLPSLIGFGYNEVTVGGNTYLDVGFGSYDDDATTWEVYEKKGGWPTTDGSEPTVDMSKIDTTFLRFAGSVDQSSYRRSMAGMINGEVWYAVAVAKNSFGQAGLPVRKMHTVAASPTIASLTGLTLTPLITDPPLSKSILATWTTNSATSPTEPVYITAERVGFPGTLITATRQANQDYTINVGETLVATGGVLRTWTVTVTMNGTAVTRTVKFRVAETPTGDTLTLSANAQIFDYGACDVLAGCTGVQSRPHIRLITWTLTVNGVTVTNTSTPYRIFVEWANTVGTPAPVDWMPFAYGVNAAERSLYDSTYCQYSSASGTSTYWRYRLTVVDTSGVVVAGVNSVVTSVLSDTLTECPSFGPGGNAT